MGADIREAEALCGSVYWQTYDCTSSMFMGCYLVKLHEPWSQRWDAAVKSTSIADSEALSEDSKAWRLELRR